jgi:hypothetical protein
MMNSTERLLRLILTSNSISHFDSKKYFRKIKKSPAKEKKCRSCFWLCCVLLDSYKESIFQGWSKNEPN